MSRPALPIPFLLLMLLTLPAAAEEVIIDSQSPYWEVGARDKTLSRACSLGRFNQKERHLYVIQLHAKKGGADVLGVAKGTGLNLWDPDHHGLITEDYFFLDDGTSNCSVFVGGRNGINPTPAAPTSGPAPG
jgi:hypothetical protein